MTAKKMEPPKIGNMYRCGKCGMEIHVTKGCECEECTTEFKCCGKPLDNVTSLPVQDS